MREATLRLGGLDAIVVGDLAQAELTVVLLHGFGMRATDLSPFAHSLRLPNASFVFPDGPVALPDGRRAWWPIDEEARACSIRSGPRDLAEEDPPGRVRARAALLDLMASLPTARRRLLLTGFSQGGMLACDTLLMTDLEVDGLAMLSSSRIAISDWMRRRARLQGRPVFVSHGRADHDLAFAAGDRLQGFYADAGAQVTWVPFDGGHEIPFYVWRKFRAFAASIHSGTVISQDGAGERSA